MKHVSPTDVERAREAAAEISELLTIIATTDHDGEKEQQADLLRAYIAPAPGHTIVNLAQEILDIKTANEIDEFIAATRQRFYINDDIARRAAEECQSVRALRHLRDTLSSSPSVEQAERLRGVFAEFIESPAAIALSESSADGNPQTHSAGDVSPVESASAVDAGHTETPTA